MKKQLYYKGPNYTVDPIVLTTEPTPQVLLIQRADTGEWALPGGFIDPTDANSEAAAKRELHEETGLAIETNGELVYQGRVSDKRESDTAWIETSAYVFYVDEALNVEGRDDAISATWHAVDTLEMSLYGSHRMLIQKALGRKATQQSS